MRACARYGTAMFRRVRGGPVGALALVALAAALLASTALASTDLAQREGVDGCVEENGLNGECQNGRGLVAPTGIALSPDGRNAYVVASNVNPSNEAGATWNSVATLVRDQAGGALHPIDDRASCLVVVQSAYSDCDPARALQGAEGVAVSPDGRNVYVAARVSDAIAVLDRDPETGLLTQSSGDDGCIDAAGAEECAEGRALDGASQVEVSADGEYVYVASSATHGGIAVFRRDPESGDLTQAEGTAGCVNENGSEGCADGFSVLTRPEDVELSPDDGFAYVASRPGDQIVVFERDGGDGTLTRVAGPEGCVNETGIDGCREAKALGDPVALAFDASGGTLYAAAERDDAIVIFDRDPTTGALAEEAGIAGCVSNTGWANPMNAHTLGMCQDGIALDGVNAIAVAPDGGALYASSGLSDGIAIFERHADGALAQRPGPLGCVTQTGYESPAAYWTAGFCLDGRALRQADSVLVGPDSGQLYATAREGAVDTFDVLPSAGPPPAAQPPAPPEAVVRHRPNRRSCKRVIRKRRAATRRLAKALRLQRRLRRRLGRDGESTAELELLSLTHRRVKKLRAIRHLARHRERRLCK